MTAPHENPSVTGEIGTASSTKHEAPEGFVMMPNGDLRRRLDDLLRFYHYDDVSDLVDLVVDNLGGYVLVEKPGLDGDS